MEIPTYKSRVYLIQVCAIIILVCASSCEPEGPINYMPPFPIYKFKNDNYNEYVHIRMNEDKTRIVSFPTNGSEYLDSIYADFYKGYYLGGYYDPYTIILDILIEDYDSVFRTLDEYSFEGHILDFNPFEEFYYDDDDYLGNNCPACVYNDTIWPTYDTSKFHKLVDDQTLDIYLNRVL